MKNKEIVLVFLALAAALFIRVYFVPAPGYINDIKGFKIWSQTATDYGIIRTYVDQPPQFAWALPRVYLPPYIYILKAIGHFYKIFYPGFDENTYLFNFLVKFPAILADILISICVFSFLRKDRSFKTSFLAMAAYAFNPAVIFLS